MEPSQQPGDQPAPENDEHSIAGYVREAWSQALVAVGDTGEEVQKILGRVTGWVEVGPDEARRLAAELTDKLKHERDLLEGTVEAAVRRAVTPFRLPSREDVAALDTRLATLEERIDRLLAARRDR